MLSSIGRICLVLAIVMLSSVIISRIAVKHVAVLEAFTNADAGFGGLGVSLETTAQRYTRAEVYGILNGENHFMAMVILIMMLMSEIESPCIRVLILLPEVHTAPSRGSGIWGTHLSS